MEAAIGDDNTWYEFLPVLSWIIADAAVARQTLEQAVQQLDRSAAEANRLAAIAHWASYATVLCLLRRDIYVALDLDRDRVADLRREEPLAAAAAAAAEPGPGAALRPNCGLLINVGRGIVLLLRTEPSEHVMHSFSLRWEEDRDAWYPGWLSHVKREVTHALHRLNRARSDAERVHPDLARFLAVPTSSEPEGAATAVEACVATAERCGRAAHHAREASENLRRVLVTLRGLRDDILDDPPPRRLMQFFGPPIADADAAGAAAAGDEAAAAGD